jgi:hypothetical protein
VLRTDEAGLRDDSDLQIRRDGVIFNRAEKGQLGIPSPSERIYKDVSSLSKNRAPIWKYH